MTLKNIILLCIAVFIAYKFILSPLLIVINPTRRVIRYKKIENKMGKRLVSFPHETIKIKKNIVILISICILIILILSVVRGTWLTTMVFIFWMSIIFSVYVDKMYSSKNGVYEKGIVFYEFYLWKDMHSWKNINGEYISILKKDGLRFDLVRYETNEQIEQILICNGIQQEQ